MTTKTPVHNRIAELNDAFRRAGPNPDWVLTAGVAERGVVFVALACRAVMAQTEFASDDDPYGEHDFGAFTLHGEKLFWKIDCYDLALKWGSDDPSDPAITRRVMTIMLATEY
jgi:hypothetical protein